MDKINFYMGVPTNFKLMSLSDILIIERNFSLVSIET